MMRTETLTRKSLNGTLSTEAHPHTDSVPVSASACSPRRKIRATVDMGVFLRVWQWCCAMEWNLISSYDTTWVFHWMKFFIIITRDVPDHITFVGACKIMDNNPYEFPLCSQKKYGWIFWRKILEDLRFRWGFMVKMMMMMQASHGMDALIKAQYVLYFSFIYFDLWYEIVAT